MNVGGLNERVVLVTGRAQMHLRSPALIIETIL